MQRSKTLETPRSRHQAGHLVVTVCVYLEAAVPLATVTEADSKHSDGPTVTAADSTALSFNSIVS